MTPSVIGWEETQATKRLAAEGLRVSRIEYVSKRGVEQADSTRVIRQRERDDGVVELTVSHFKTKVDDNWESSRI